jgi:hypothetical protein
LRAAALRLLRSGSRFSGKSKAGFWQFYRRFCGDFYHEKLAIQE